MLSFNVLLQTTCNTICKFAHIASGWVRRIWEGCGGAREDRQVSSFSAGLQKSFAPRKITSSAKKPETRFNQFQPKPSLNPMFIFLIPPSTVMQCSNQIWTCANFLPRHYRTRPSASGFCDRIGGAVWLVEDDQEPLLPQASKEFLEGFRSVCCRLCGTPSKWNAADLNCSHLADTLTVRSQTQSYDGNQLSVALGSLSHN